MHAARGAASFEGKQRYPSVVGCTYQCQLPVNNDSSQPACLTCLSAPSLPPTMPQPPNKQLAVFGKRFNSYYLFLSPLLPLSLVSRLSRCRRFKSRQYHLARGKVGKGVESSFELPLLCADKVERSEVVIDDGRRRNRRIGAPVVTSIPTTRLPNGVGPRQMECLVSDSGATREAGKALLGPFVSCCFLNGPINATPE